MNECSGQSAGILFSRIKAEALKDNPPKRGFFFWVELDK
jgi:hypothetical protein